jgi:hypothetical protein
MRCSSFPFLLLLLAMVLTATSCDKEVFPKEDEIVGHWLEQDASKPVDELNRLVITDTQFTIIDFTGGTNTLNYTLEKKSGSILLTEPTYGGTAALEINYNRREETLGIYGLFMAIPENQKWYYFERTQ